MVFLPFGMIRLSVGIVSVAVLVIVVALVVCICLCPFTVKASCDRNDV